MGGPNWYRGVVSGGNRICSFRRTVFTVRRYELHGLSYGNSGRLSVRLSVTLVDCVHMV